MVPVCCYARNLRGPPILIRPCRGPPHDCNSANVLRFGCNRYRKQPRKRRPVVAVVLTHKLLGVLYGAGHY